MSCPLLHMQFLAPRCCSMFEKHLTQFHFQALVLKAYSVRIQHIHLLFLSIANKAVHTQA